MLVASPVPHLRRSRRVPHHAASGGLAELSRAVQGAGLLRRRPGRYALRSAAVVAAYATVVAAVVALGDSWWALILAAALAGVFGQLALLAHDIAHRQVCRRRRPADWLGRLAGDLGVGLSHGWWVDKHGRHHAHPNHTELDPDVGPGLVSWSAAQAQRARGPARFVARHQRALFFPLLLLEGLHLAVSSVRAVARRAVPAATAEAALLAAHHVGYVAFLALTLSPVKALAFAAVHHGLFGLYLGCAFAPNHTGMPCAHGDDELDRVRRQVVTSRNVRGGRLLDMALGGLNHQIEHHLFPTMPAPNLRRARPIVADHCRRHGLPYTEAGLIECYGDALRHLHAVGAPLRRRRRR